MILNSLTNASLESGERRRKKHKKKERKKERKGGKEGKSVRKGSKTNDDEKNRKIEITKRQEKSLKE